MSNTSQGPGWWLASDGKWYPPELWTGPPTRVPATDRAARRPTRRPPTAQPVHRRSRRAARHNGIPPGRAMAPAPARRSVPQGPPAYGASPYAMPATASTRRRASALRPGRCRRRPTGWPSRRSSARCAGIFLFGIPAVAGHHLRLRRPRRRSDGRTAQQGGAAWPSPASSSASSWSACSSSSSWSAPRSTTSNDVIDLVLGAVTGLGRTQTHSNTHRQVRSARMQGLLYGVRGDRWTPPDESNQPHASGCPARPMRLQELEQPDARCATTGAWPRRG